MLFIAFLHNATMNHNQKISIAIALGLVYVVWGSTYLAIHYAVSIVAAICDGMRPFCQRAGIFLLRMAASERRAEPDAPSVESIVSHRSAVVGRRQRFCGVGATDGSVGTDVHFGVGDSIVDGRVRIFLTARAAARMADVARIVAWICRTDLAARCLACDRFF